MTTTKAKARKIAGTNFYAQRISGGDRSWGQYKITDADGTFIGSATFFGANRVRSNGYQVGLRAWMPGTPTFDNLAQVAEALASTKVGA